MALSGFDIEVRPGEIVALLGPNGAGKSTALRTLLGIVKPDAGTARLFGMPPPQEAAYVRLGWQPQQTAQYPLIHVEETIDLFGSFYTRRRPTEELLAEFGLMRCRRTQFRRLSGGERQRLGLALAFVNDPELVVLDEPTSALDVAGRNAVWRLLCRFRDAGGAVLVATHLLEEAEEFADRVAILHRGTVIASAAPHELIERHARSQRRTPATNGAGLPTGSLEHVFLELTGEPVSG